MRRNSIAITSFLFAWLSVPFSAVGQEEYEREEDEDEEVTPISCMSLRCRPALFDWRASPWGPGEINRDEIQTDRPDFTEASTTVGLRTFQCETGYTFTSDSSGGTDTRSHAVGETLFRLGAFADWFELRLAVFPVTETVATGPTQVTRKGLEDLYLGCKIGLTPQSGLLPEMAIMPQFTVPTGAGAFTTGRTLPGTNLLYGWDVTDQWTFAGSTQFNRSVDGTDTLYTEWAQSLTLGRSLNDKLAGYCEWFGFFPEGANDAATEHYINGGLTYLLSSDIQWDIRIGHGLNENSADFFAGTGLSFRLRPR